MLRCLPLLKSLFYLLKLGAKSSRRLISEKCLIFLLITIINSPAGNLKDAVRADSHERRSQDKTVRCRTIANSSVHNSFSCYHSRHVNRPMRLSSLNDKHDLPQISQNLRWRSSNSLFLSFLSSSYLLHQKVGINCKPYDSQSSLRTYSSFQSGDLSEKALPSPEKFPKRWIIVLLCFVSFLLCNMDRVSLNLHHTVRFFIYLKFCF